LLANAALWRCGGRAPGEAQLLSDSGRLTIFQGNRTFNLRNAGGRASDDAIRSLLISYKLLGTREWFVVHHTNCGMETFSDETMRKLLKHSLETATLDKDGWHDVGQGPGSREGDFIDWLTISDQQQAVAADVQRIRSHPLVPRDIPIYGFIYDVATGKLMEVAEASRPGKAA